MEKEIYVLKADLKCCHSCRKKITRNLLRMSGVSDVDILVKEGLIKVSGRKNLDPQTLVLTIAKEGKTAVICSSDKISPIASDQTNNISVNQRVKSDEIEGHDSGDFSVIKCREKTNMEKRDDKNSDVDSREFNGGFSGHHPHRHGNWSQIHINEPAFVNNSVPPPGWRPLFMRPPSQFRGVGHYNNQGFRTRIGFPPPMLPPMTATYGRHRDDLHLPPYYYVEQAPAAGNGPSHQLFSDENINGCVIV